AQRRPQIMRHRIAESLQLLIGCFELLGPLADAFFQVCILPKNLLRRTLLALCQPRPGLLFSWYYRHAVVNNERINNRISFDIHKKTLRAASKSTGLISFKEALELKDAL